jgi:hypothetical protein
MRHIRLVLAATLGALVVAAVAGAAGPGYSVVPFQFDPQHLGGVNGQWVTGQGLPDAGNSNHALLLEKLLPTSALASAGATLQQTAGTTWQDQLGFDRQSNTYCGAGAPRFNVVDTTGVTHFFGCVYGTHTANGTDSQGDAWERVRFTGTDAFPPIATGTPIAAVYLVQDETGSALLDNVYYNGKVMGKPGTGVPGS